MLGGCSGEDNNMQVKFGNSQIFNMEIFDSFQAAKMADERDKENEVIKRNKCIAEGYRVTC